MSQANDGENADEGVGSGFGWSERYASGNIPWDLGMPHPELSIRLQDGRLAPPHEGARALVPGAGRAHDAIALARRGWAVTALDVVPSLEPEAAPALAKLGGSFLIEDALTYEPREQPPVFDLIWDHTFFCAIDPVDRPRWGRRATELLVPGGRYAVLAFPVGKPSDAGGPPHGMDEAAVVAALGPLFRTLESGAVSRSVKRRMWREHWILAEKVRLASTS